MCDDDIHVGLIYDPTVSRRTFGLAAVAVAGLGSAAHAQTNVVEKDVEVKTPTGPPTPRSSIRPARGPGPPS